MKRARPSPAPSPCWGTTGTAAALSTRRGGSLNGLLQVCGEEGKVHASLGFHADGHLLLEPGRLLDDPPGLLLRLMLGSLWQDQGSEPPR